MIVMKVVTIVDIMERHGGSGKQIEGIRMAISQELGSAKSVYEDGCSSDDPVSEAV